MNKKGVTLVELIIVLAISTVVIMLAYSLYFFVNRVVRASEDEFDIQASMRLTMDTLNRELRYSTAIFAVPMSSYVEANLTPGYEYLGISDDGKEIIHYKQSIDPSEPGWQKRVMVKAKDNVEYRLVFQKHGTSTDDNLIAFHFEIRTGGGDFTQFGLGSELEALQALAVRDMGTITNPAQVIAFTRNPIETNRGNIVMVLDLSGSMNRDMDGFDIGATRLNILKEEAEKLIQGLAAEENVHISLVPFASNANNPYEFIPSTSPSSLINDIKAFSASGGTNTGDGIRRAYYQFKNLSTSDSTVKHANYAIILVDGVTTFATASKDFINNDIRFYEIDGNVKPENRHDANSTEFRHTIRGPEGNNTYVINNSAGQIVGYGGRKDDVYGKAYVDLMGALLKQEIRRAYVIGFSNVDVELSSVDDIAEAVGASLVFKAGSQADLDNALNQIRDDILNDFWFLKGPSY